jgi:hypothetical protein
MSAMFRASPNLLAVLPERRDGVGMLTNNFWVEQPPHDASLSTSLTTTARLACLHLLQRGRLKSSQSLWSQRP